MKNAGIYERRFRLGMEKLQDQHKKNIRHRSHMSVLPMIRDKNRVTSTFKNSISNKITSFAIGDQE